MPSDKQKHRFFAPVLENFPIQLLRSPLSQRSRQCKGDQSDCIIALIRERGSKRALAPAVLCAN
jgi:hypothetical protein